MSELSLKQCKNPCCFYLHLGINTKCGLYCCKMCKRYGWHGNACEKIIITATTSENGRLGNQIIRNLAVSLIAEKNDLNVVYANKGLISRLGITLFSGKKTYNNAIELNENNYLTVYNSDNLKSNLNANPNFFQTKEITHLIYNYLRKDEIKTNIINNNPFKNRYNNNDDLFMLD